MSQNLKKFLFISGAIIILIAVLFVLSGGKFPQIKKQEVKNNCPVKEKQEIVRGDSLEPLIKNGQEIKILYGYYKCSEVKRGDIVAYDYKGNPEPIIKIVKAIPGDKFSFQKEETGWRILINDEILKNSENIPYLINENSYKLLRLYEKSFNGVAPENTYIILGNQPGGTLDSTRFGLIDKNDIIGRVEIKIK